MLLLVEMLITQLAFINKLEMTLQRFSSSYKEMFVHVGYIVHSPCIRRKGHDWAVTVLSVSAIFIASVATNDKLVITSLKNVIGLYA